MKVAILYNGSGLMRKNFSLSQSTITLSRSTIAPNLIRLSKIFKSFGHETICIDASKKKLAVYFLKKHNIEYIHGYKLCCAKLLDELGKFTSFLKIPVIDCYCDDCINLKLLNFHRKNHSSRIFQVKHSNH